MDELLVVDVVLVDVDEVVVAVVVDTVVRAVVVFAVVGAVVVFAVVLVDELLVSISAMLNAQILFTDIVCSKCHILFEWPLICTKIKQN